MRVMFLPGAGINLDRLEMKFGINLGGIMKMRSYPQKLKDLNVIRLKLLHAMPNSHSL